MTTAQTHETAPDTAGTEAPKRRAPIARGVDVPTLFATLDAVRANPDLA